jgi:two-component system chemotaxis response regulator CheB
MTPVKLLIVDDSLFIRSSLKKILSVPEIEIIDTASNGQEAVEKTKLHNPDVILLDVEMPVMNGIEALKQIMKTNPTPVLMFSTMTQEGSTTTVEAMSLGAVDFIPKEAGYYDLETSRKELLKKIIEIGSNSFLKTRLKSKLSHSTGAGDSKVLSADDMIAPKKSKQNLVSDKKRPDPSKIQIVCIGISTGGPVALQEVIPQLPGDYPVPILIVQHMPPHFTESLSKRLDQSSKINVKEAADGDQLKPGTVYIAKGGFQIVVSKHQTVSIVVSPPTELFKPSVNFLMKSIVEVYKDKAVGVIMTGMGNDGQVGLKSLKDAGGFIIAQTPESCVVAGMPRAVIDNNIAHEIQPLHCIADTLVGLFRK